MEKPGPARGHDPEQRRSPRKAQDAYRLRRLKAVNRADELVPARQPHHPDRVKVLRPLRLNAAEAELGKARDLPSPARPEQREQHRGQVSRVHRRNSKNMVASQRDDQVSSQIPHMVGQDRFRRRVTREDLSVSGSERRHLWAQLNVSNVELVRHPDFGNQSRRLLVADPRVRRAAKERKCGALMVSRFRHNSASSRSSGRKVARLHQPIRVRATDSRKVDRRDNQRKRHRHGHNNFGAITLAAPEVKLRGRFFRCGCRTAAFPFKERRLGQPSISRLTAGKPSLLDYSNSAI